MLCSASKENHVQQDITSRSHRVVMRSFSAYTSKYHCRRHTLRWIAPIGPSYVTRTASTLPLARFSEIYIDIKKKYIKQRGSALLYAGVSI